MSFLRRLLCRLVGHAWLYDHIEDQYVCMECGAVKKDWEWIESHDH